MSHRVPIDPLLPHLSWEEILSWAELEYRRRSGSGSLQALCIFHQERNPSLFFYHRGVFICYGCRASGSRLEFISHMMAGEMPSSNFLSKPPRLYLGGWVHPPPIPGQLEFDFSEIRRRRSWRES